MKSTLNNACISALLCGAVIIAVPAFAAGLDGAVGGSANGVGGTTARAENRDNGAVGTTTTMGANAGGASASGNVNSTNTANSTAGVNRQTQSTASNMTHKAENRANGAVEQSGQANASANAGAGAAVH